MLELAFSSIGRKVSGYLPTVIGGVDRDGPTSNPTEAGKVLSFDPANGREEWIDQVSSGGSAIVYESAQPLGSGSSTLNKTFNGSGEAYQSGGSESLIQWGRSSGGDRRTFNALWSSLSVPGTATVSNLKVNFFQQAITSVGDIQAVWRLSANGQSAPDISQPVSDANNGGYVESVDLSTGLQWLIDNGHWTSGDDLLITGDYANAGTNGDIYTEGSAASNPPSATATYTTGPIPIAVSGRHYLVNLSSAADEVTYQLPGSPSQGDRIAFTIVDDSPSYSLSFDAMGSLMNGKAASTYTISAVGDGVDLEWNGSFWSVVTRNGVGS
ncbi:MAG: hypothetical protein AAGA03_15145 [Planctomycetota bacterium]